MKTFYQLKKEKGKEEGRRLSPGKFFHRL